MAANVTLTFINDQNFFLPIDMTQYAAYYDMTKVTHRMQARPLLGGSEVAYAWSSNAADDVRGSITVSLNGTLVNITAPVGDMINLPAANYVYAYGFQYDEPSAKYVVEDVWYGSLIVSQGCIYT